MVLINPWVRDETTVDQAVVRHYYLAQIRSGAFWRRLAGGDIDVRESLSDLVRRVAAVVRRRLRATATDAAGPAGADDPSLQLYERVTRGLVAYQGRVLLILSGADLTAQEFEESVLKGRRVQSWRLGADCQILRLDGANHTFSARHWREKVHETAIGWILTDAPARS